MDSTDSSVTLSCGLNGNWTMGEREIVANESLCTLVNCDLPDVDNAGMPVIRNPYAQWSIVACQMYRTFRANPAKTGGLIFITLISFPKFNFLYLT